LAADRDLVIQQLHPLRLPAEGAALYPEAGKPPERQRGAPNEHGAGCAAVQSCAELRYHEAMPPRPTESDPRRPGNAIELELRDVTLLFNPLDPSPVTERDLDRAAEEFIVSWARELPQSVPLRLIIRLGKPLSDPFTPREIEKAVHHYFAYRRSINRLELRQLFKLGRMSLLIGVSFLSLCLLLSHLIAPRAGLGAFSDITREGLTIGGWVAMWRPMQIYLYDWWPLRRSGRLLDRLSRIEVELRVARPAEQLEPADHPARELR
jgi:hypothetical protein